MRTKFTVLLILIISISFMGFTGTYLMVSDLNILSEGSKVKEMYYLKDTRPSDKDYEVTIYLLKNGMISEKNGIVKNLEKEDIYFVLARYTDIVKGTVYTKDTFNKSDFVKKQLTPIGLSKVEYLDDIKIFVQSLK